MIRAPQELETTTTIPDGCILGPAGEWIYDTRTVHVEAVADHYGRPVIEVDGYYACVRVFDNGQILILRAPVDELVSA